MREWTGIGWCDRPNCSVGCVDRVGAGLAGRGGAGLGRRLAGSLLGQTWHTCLLFLVLYYSLQARLPKMRFQPVRWLQVCVWLDVLCWSEDGRAECRDWIQKMIIHWETFQTTITRLVTFFMGFYVSVTAKRWWDQGRTPINIFLYFTTKQELTRPGRILW